MSSATLDNLRSKVYENLNRIVFVVQAIVICVLCYLGGQMGIDRLTLVLAFAGAIMFMMEANEGGGTLTPLSLLAAAAALFFAFLVGWLALGLVVILMGLICFMMAIVLSP